MSPYPGLPRPTLSHSDTSTGPVCAAVMQCLIAALDHVKHAVTATTISISVRPCMSVLESCCFKCPPVGGTLVTDGGPARLFSPYVPKPPGAPAAATLPMMFYMPGIDGTGLAAYRQFPRLTRAFDLRCLIIPRTDRSTFDELTDYVAVSGCL